MITVVRFLALQNLFPFNLGEFHAIYMQNSIDNLPNEVLISIVSLLPTKEAARISVLAKRWQKLWSHVTILNFDGMEAICQLLTRKEAISSENPMFANQVIWMKEKMLEAERKAFIGGVNKALISHSSETLNEFRVFFDLDDNNFIHINDWLEFALAKKVKRLELNLVQSCTSSTSADDEYGRYKLLNISPIFHISTPSSSTFDTLVSLRLSGVYVNEEALEHFVCNAPCLEELSVRYLTGLRNLRLHCKAIQLRSVTIAHCEGFTSIEICSPKLISCSLSMSSMKHFIIISVTSITNLFLEAPIPMELSNKLLEISGSLSRLETLTLRTVTSLGDGELEFPNLPRLKTLVIFDTTALCSAENLLCCAPILKAAPSLHKMVVKKESPSWNFEKPTSLWTPGVAQRRYKGSRHERLRVLEVRGFCRGSGLVEFLAFVLECASSLEKMIVDGEVMVGDGLNSLYLLTATL